MEQIIKRAIEGGWKYKNADSIDVIDGNSGRPPFNLPPRITARYKDGYAHNVTIADVTFQSSFWQALGKACGWPEKEGIGQTDKKGRIRNTWIEEGLRFHEINLTEGWEKAVAYLKSITN